MDKQLLSQLSHLFKSSRQLIAILHCYCRFPMEMCYVVQYLFTTCFLYPISFFPSFWHTLSSFFSSYTDNTDKNSKTNLGNGSFTKLIKHSVLLLWITRTYCPKKLYIKFSMFQKILNVFFYVIFLRFVFCIVVSMFCRLYVLSFYVLSTKYRAPMWYM